MLWVESDNIKLFIADEYKDSDGILTAIKKHKPAILDYLVSNKIFSREDFKKKTIFKTNSDEALLSFAQERLWFIELYEQGSNAYHIPLVIDLDADTDLDGIKYVLQQIVSRHEVLRSTIEHGSAGEHGIQRVHEDPLVFEAVALTDKQDVKSFIEKDITQPFDLSAEYPIRVKFYTIQSIDAATKSPLNRTILLINFHHIASDGWSIEIFQKEWAAYYEAYINNDTAFRLPELEIQYKDYAVWQRAYLTGKIIDNQLGYWRDKLSGFQTLELPTDFTRPVEIDYRGSSQAFIADKVTSQKLKELAQRNGVTLHSVLLSSINILLSKYSGQNDIVIGSVIANRHQRQTQGLIGFFVNTQANRTLLNPSQSFEDLVQQVHREQEQAQLHQDLPFEKLVVELGVERDPSAHPVFQVMFTVESSAVQQEAANEPKDDLKPPHTEFVYEVEKFDLSINIDESQAELTGKFSYATALFRKDTIERLIHHYLYLLEQLTESPEQPYSKISLLSPGEYRQIVYQWNDTDRDYAKDKTISQLFEEQAEKVPDNIALVFEGRQLSYKQLNEKSNQLARYIREQYQQVTKQTLTPGTLIALYLDRSLEMVIGILAVLKAGGAYVPIDLTYPKERINYILENTGAELILCQRQQGAGNHLQLPQDKVIHIDLQDGLYNTADTANLPQHSKPTDLAYVTYTSGTTGHPKGVMIEQASVINLINDLITRYGIDSSERFLLFANYVFDASVEQMWLPLLSGGALIVIDNGSINDSNSFENYIAKYRITHLHATPSFLSLIDPSKLFTLKRIVFGAEYLSKQLFDLYKTVIPTIINEYGPTESTITFLASINSNLLGRPTIQNTKAYVLDPGNHPVPIGITGELYIGGACLARGYLNSPGLTKERFIVNPFATEADKANGYTRLYKTGDLVKWLPGGNLEYIGRNDDQVKIRGYRIELGEIEHALAQIAGIKQSCVVAKERKTQSGSTKYLVGYYVLNNNGDALTQTVISDKLLQVLPEYMVPGTLVAMESLPLSINGKLDKRALPDPGFSSQGDEYAAPTTTIEAAICSIWQEVLGLDKVSITDNFFKIGGDSILSIQVSGRIRQAGFICQVKDIFECKTIARLAEYLSKKNSALSIKSEQGIITGASDLLPIQQWFIEKVESGAFPKPNHWNHSFLLKVPELNQAMLQSVIEKLFAYHDMLRIQFRKEQDPGESTGTKGIHWKQVYQPAIALPELKRLDVSSHTATQIQDILTHWQSGFHLERGPLFSAGYLYGYEDGSARIYLALHHMIVDTVSWRILTEDIQTLYEGRNLPQKGSSYRQWVAGVNNYTHQYPKEASWWEKQLDGMPNYHLNQQDIDPTEQSFELDKTWTRALLQIAPKAYHTEINDLLLTALAYALKDINQNNVQGITLEGHGREDIDPSLDTSRTAGWFTTMFPVRLELQNDLRGSIRSIKESLRSIPSKGIGFGAFAASKETVYTNNDLPPISFNYLGQFDTSEGYWQIAAEDSGQSMHSANTDHNLVNINGMVINRKLGFSIVTKLGEQTTNQLSESFKTQLTKIIKHCKEKLETEGSSYTPGDFNSVRISQSLLDRIAFEADANQNEIVHIYPATSLQQGFIYHVLSQANDDAYRVQLLLDYHIPIDVDKYLQAWSYCIAQYPILRTAFNWEEDIIQIIYQQGKLDYKVHDVSHLDTREQRDAAIEAIQVEDRKQSFDLAVPTLFRLHIIKQAPDHYTILKSDHHSIADGWSGPILLTSLHQYYDAIIENKKVNIKQDRSYLEAQEYICRNREMVQQYWDATLARAESANDINALLSQSIDFNSYRQVEQPATTILEIRDDFFNALKAFSQREGITLNVIVQFAWHKLLQVYSGAMQSIVGTTVSGRDLPVEDIEDSVGFYINTLPLLIDWNNNHSIMEQLHQVQQKITEMSTHSFADLAKLQKDGERLFHSLFVYENYPLPKGDEETSVISLRDSIEKVDYPLNILAFEYNDTLTVSLGYDGKYLTGARARQHITTLERIIHQLIKDPYNSHQQISLISPEEYDQIIYGWNQAGSVYRKDSTICELFEKQAEKTPDSLALVFGLQQLTYRYLNEKSNQLARYIRTQYLQRTKKALVPDTLIALYLDRSPEMVIGILGVLKAGGAYVPIDTNYPQERINYMLEDTAAQLILSQRHLSESSTTQLPKEMVIHIDLAETLYVTEPSLNLPQYSKATDLAYVIYTSGTTGNPKGVMAEQHQIVSFAVENNFIDYEKVGVVAGLSNYAFDGSIFDIFFSLINGKKLVLIDNGFLLESSVLDDQLIKFNVDTIFITTALFNSLVQNQSRCLNTLKQIMFGGEACNRKIINSFKNCYGQTSLIHVYGPTENIVYSSYCKLNDYNTTDVVPIGKHLADKYLYILGSSLSPVPTGVTGELYIGGAGVARGYLNLPGITKERFIANPFATEADNEKGYARLYKTGDLVRWLPDGNLEYIGRNDDQVKIRGYRIELGEIEYIFSKIAGIKQSCVLVKERKAVSGSTKYLVGYYVLNNSGDTLTQAGILNKLSQSLPEYMIPGAMVQMESFPLTINGKLDKRAMPDPDFSSEEYVAPVTEKEETVCNIWQEVLGLDRVGITDNFFRVGGNSILAIQVSHRMSRALGCDTKVSDVFKYKTILQLLTYGLGRTVVSIPKSGANQSALSFAQERLWFIEQYEQGSNAYHIPMVIELDADTDLAGIKYAIQQIISRHAVLRSTIEHGVSGEHGIQRMHEEPLLMEEITVTDKQDFRSLIEEDINRPFDLSVEYPIRVNFYTIQSADATMESPVSRTVLLINFHHIASDGWSIDIFQKEWAAYYEAYINTNTHFSLPALEIQYKDYAVWQRTYLTGDILKKQLSYWKDKLSGYQTLELPTDYVRPGKIDYSGSSLGFKLNEQTSQKLRALAQRYGVTLHSVLLSSINILLGKYTGQEDIITGSVIANRQYPQTESLIGFFVNTQANRILLSRSQSFVELVQQVYDDQAEAQLYQDLPFEKLVEELGVERDLSRHPVFQVMVGLQSFGNREMAAGEEEKNYLKTFQTEDVYEVAKFDLSFFIVDASGELTIQISYATALFRKDTIARLIDHYTHLLNQLAEAPEKSYSQLSLLSPAEYDQVVYQWNTTGNDYPKDKTVARLFQEQVEKTPDKAALVYEGFQLSYKQLNEKSNRLARHIRDQYQQRTNQPLAPDTPVALYLDRSLEMVIGILAVLKAGGAYVPMDTSYPQERIDYILHDSRAKLILGKRRPADNNNIQLPQEKVLYVDLAEALYDIEDSSNLPQHSKATDLAYMIYTSGSTGKPKGVMVEQRSIPGLVFNDYIRLSGSDVFAFLSSPVFDATTFEIWTPLLNGNTLAIPNDLKNPVSDINTFKEFMAFNKVSILFMTKTLFESLYYSDDSVFADLNYLITGGETLDRKMVNKIINSHTRPTHLLNAYGPTESTTFTTIYDVKSQVISAIVPIGKPINNRSTYVLDPNRIPVPVGVIGELYIGGAGIARGYLNRPDLSEESFIPNPFATEADRAGGYTRLYKTGDLVRWLPDGNLEFIGRNDDQVKIRGFRIELGEIAHALSQITGIKQNCVLVKERETESGINKYLIAYYTLDNSDGMPDRSVIEKKLLQMLPEYMVPDALIEMESFPFNSNGKLDKRALPDPDFSSPEEEYVEPATETEERICKIWQEILGVHRVGITDNFFRIGGNSILAIQVSHRMSKTLGCDVHVADVFKLKSIQMLLDNVSVKQVNPDNVEWDILINI
ncbi:MAG: amino acid adenylation domain-containing protein [Ferruginibacter sp.]